MAWCKRPKLPDFWLAEPEDVRLFATSQWPIHQCIYLTYRACLAVYLGAWYVTDLATTPYGSVWGNFVFLTNWTFTALTLYAVTSCAGAVYFAFSDRGFGYNPTTGYQLVRVSGHDPQSLPGDPSAADGRFASPPGAETEQTGGPCLPNYFKLTWLLFNISLTVCPVVTTAFWMSSAPPDQPLPLAIDVNKHALNTVFIYLDLLLSAIPVRLVHFITVYLYASLYFAFTWVYYLAGGVHPLTGDTALYRDLLDWSEPGRTGLVAVVNTAALVVFQLAGYGGYRLRVYIYRRHFDTKPED